MSRLSLSDRRPLFRGPGHGKAPLPEEFEDDVSDNFQSIPQSKPDFPKQNFLDRRRRDREPGWRFNDGRSKKPHPERLDWKSPTPSVPDHTLEKLLTTSLRWGNIPRWVNSATATAPDDPYEVLGVSSTASVTHFHSAFHHLAEMWSMDGIKIWGPTSGLSEDVLLKRRFYVVETIERAYDNCMSERRERERSLQRASSFHYDGFAPSSDCGVPDSDGLLRCHFSILCVLHSLDAKRAAAGGRLEFDRRLAESEKEINDLLLRVQDSGERKDLEEHLSDIRAMMVNDEDKPEMYVHYTISEDRCGDQDAVTSDRLAALASRDDGPRFKHASLALLGKRGGLM